MVEKRIIKPLEDQIPKINGGFDESLPLITELEIRHRVSILARQIAVDFEGKEFCVVAILKGAFMLLADLLRRLNALGMKPTVDFMRASSYGSTDQSSGKVDILLNISNDLRGKRVLIIDDIVDSGRTLSAISAELIEQGVAEVTTCVLLDKPSRREVEFKPDYTGFIIPDKFVVGYGMDYNEEFRYLPHIAVLNN